MAEVIEDDCIIIRIDGDGLSLDQWSKRIDDLSDWCGENLKSMSRFELIDNIVYNGYGEDKVEVLYITVSNLEDVTLLQLRWQ